MADDSFMGTSVTLLGRLREDAADQAAWREFVGRYSRPIYAWCRHWGLQEADAQDVTQTVLMRLAERLRTFQYDPARSFRAYLKTVTQYAWRDFLDDQRRPGAGAGGSTMLQVLNEVQARDDLVKHLQAEFDQELFQEAAARVQQRVEPHTWEAFRLLALEGLAGAEVAQRLGMKVLTVFKARSKVQKMLQAEIAELERGEE